VKPLRTVRPRTLAAAGVAAAVTLGAAGAVSATTEPPTTEPANTAPGGSAAPDASAGPDVSAAPGGTSGVLAETTYPFAEGEYHWSTDYGTVPHAAGDIEVAAGGITLIAVTKGVVGVTGADGAVAEVADGTAVSRPEGDPTVIGAIDAAFGSFTTFDIEPGVDPDGGPSFTPGAGDRTVTLTSAVIEPGTALDLNQLGADFAYVVVVKGIVDVSDGTELVPHGAVAWSTDAGPVTIGPRSPNVAAEVLVVTVAPAA
jgi:hypothetical protein